jgi:preprotein translocase subunit YajC
VSDRPEDYAVLLHAPDAPMAALITFLPLLVILYFLMIRPQQKRAQAQAAMMRSVQEGDEVITTGGFYGYITAVEDDVFWLELADGVQVRVAKAAIMRRIDSAPGDVHEELHDESNGDHTVAAEGDHASTPADADEGDDR